MSYMQSNPDNSNLQGKRETEKKLLEIRGKAVFTAQ